MSDRGRSVIARKCSVVGLSRGKLHSCASITPSMKHRCSMVDDAAKVSFSEREQHNGPWFDVHGS